MPVEATNLVMASEKAVVRRPMTALMPVMAMPSLRPPMRASENLTLKQQAMTVRMMTIIGAAPMLMMGVKTALAKPMI